MNIFCVGRNYIDHAKELGNAVPQSPVIFMKPSTALLPNDTAMPYPSFSNDVHFETELVIKICKSGRNISKEEAKNYYNKITVGIDFTARDIQTELKNKGLPWEKAKAWDNSAVIGNWIELNTVNNPSAIVFSMTKNKEVVQKGNSNDMLFSFDTIVADISHYFTLYPNDIIFTGTPAGVGACNKGDVFEGFLFDTKVFVVAIQ